MYPMMEFPRTRRDQVELGVVDVGGGMRLQLVLGRYASNPRLPQIRALQVCPDGMHDVYAILTSSSDDIAGSLGPWQVAFASREVLAPRAQCALVQSALLLPTARVVGSKRHPVWTIHAAALTPEARAHVCRMFGWLLPHVCAPLAANDEAIDSEGRDGRDPHSQERVRRREGETA